MATRLMYCIENNRDKFPFEAMTKLGWEEFWCPPTQRLHIPRMYKSDRNSADPGTPEWGGTYEAVGPQQTIDKINEQIAARIPVGSRNPVVVLDIEWSIPRTIAALNYIDTVVKHIKSLRPGAMVAIYSSQAGSDVLDAVAPSFYLGKPTQVEGSDQFRWSPDYRNQYLESQASMFREDKKKIGLVHTVYTQGGPNQGRALTDQDLAVSIEFLFRKKVDIIGLWHAFNPAKGKSQEMADSIVQFAERVNRILGRLPL